MRAQVAIGLWAWLALFCVLTGAPPGAAAAAAADTARVIRVGPKRAVQQVSAAARLAMDGTVVEIDAGDYAGDVAVWKAARLTIRGIGGRVRLMAGGASAEGKAIWVFRGGEVTVEDVEFSGARVQDRNGAGIRLEGGHLTVRRCRFLDSENGILTSNDPAAALNVEDSEFAHLGAGDGQSHGIYVGAIARFRLTGSHVHHAQVGHLVKSRARVNRIENNLLADGTGGRASYELEFPNGGVAEVLGNVIQQSATTENSIMVSFGAEGYRGPEHRLTLEGNTLVNLAGPEARFVRVATGAESVHLVNNLLVGQGTVDAGAGARRTGNQALAVNDLVAAEQGDFRLTPSARERLRRTLPAGARLPGAAVAGP